MANYLSIFFFVFLSLSSQAGIIKGNIKNTKGESLPYCSVLVKNTNTGTMANAEGDYELSLKNGAYELVFQYLGHKTLLKNIEVGNSPQVLNIVLEEQAVLLKEAIVGKTAEDPANSIMRKTIAVAEFHRKAVQSFTALAYTKGSFLLSDVPFIAKNALKKEGYVVGTTYLMEQVQSVEFSQPASYKQKILSIRSNIPEATTTGLLNAYQANFYNNKVFNMISPLSANAFGVYKFVYEGFFEENGLTINKIRVIPRSEGPSLFNGSLLIVENTWEIHSLSLAYQTQEGFLGTIKEILNPVQEVWTPIHFESHIKVSIMGFKGEGKYLTSMRNYALKTNPRYIKIPAVVDDKTDKEAAKKLMIQPQNSTKIALQQKELTTKQLQKLAKVLAKEEKIARKKQGEDLAVVRNDSISVDTLARKRNPDFWNNTRQVPLTLDEQKSYAIMDSLRKIKENSKDSIGLKYPNRFKIMHLFSGNLYHYGRKDELYGYPSTLSLASLVKIHYNTVEGYRWEATSTYTKKTRNLANGKYFSITPTLRYSFGNNQFQYKLLYDNGNAKNKISLSGGSFNDQFNAQNPISLYMNDVYSLLFKENFMKIYQKNFGELKYSCQLSGKIRLNTGVEYSQRKPLDNLSNAQSWVMHESKQFTPNKVVSAENSQQIFVEHTAIKVSAAFVFLPFAKVRIMNGRRIMLKNNSPEFRLSNIYTVIPHQLAGNVSEQRFHQLQFAVTDQIELNGRGRFGYRLQTGVFLGDKPEYIADFKHFNGDQTLFVGETFDNFRLLNYYNYSTSQKYMEVSVNYTFRKCLFTQLKTIQMLGWNEYIFSNHFSTPLHQYTEVGYGLYGIFRFLGVEGVAAYSKNMPNQYAIRVRIGI